MRNHPAWRSVAAALVLAVVPSVAAAQVAIADPWVRGTVAGQRATDHPNLRAIGLQHRLRRHARGRLENAFQRGQRLAQAIASDIERHAGP